MIQTRDQFEDQTHNKQCFNDPQKDYKKKSQD